MLGAAGIPLALIAAALTTTMLAALRTRGVVPIFLLTQVVFWSLSYLARPLVLLWAQPQPRFADPVADPRLAEIGYDHAIAEVLQPVVLGLWVNALLVLGYAVWSRSRTAATTVRSTNPDLVATLTAVYVIGLLGRAAAYVNGSAGSAGQLRSQNAVLSLVAALAALGAVGLIIFFRPPDRRLSMLTVGGLICVELLWSAAAESKTPIISATLAVAVRFGFAGWTRRRSAIVLALAAVGFGAFGWLQGLKESAATTYASTVVDAGYPVAIQPFLPILRRFDLLAAATDGYYLGGRAWLSPGEVLVHGLESLVPAQLLGSEKFQAGVSWAREVRGASVDMAKISVSLAEGNINEGYVLGGYVGVVVDVLFTFVLLLLAVRALRSRSTVLTVLGLAVTASPVLFERGILGSTELLGKVLQLVVVVWIVDLVVREFRKRPVDPVGAIPRRHDIGAWAGTRAKGLAMPLTKFLLVLRRRWLTIAATTLVCLAAAAVYASTIPTQYTATTRLYVSMATGTSVSDAYEGGMAAEQRVPSYARVASGATVAEWVIRDLGLRTMSPAELEEKISVDYPPATTLLDISVTDASPERAQLLADGVAAQFRKLVGQMETTVRGAAPAAQASVVAPAAVPTQPTAPHTSRLLLIGVLGGLALGCLAAFVRDRLDGRVRTRERLAELLPVPVLVTIPGVEPTATKAFALLRARLKSAGGGLVPRTLLVTSFSEQSTPSVAVRFSQALGASGRRVALVDADTSGDGISACMDMASAPGLADWLRAPQLSLDELVQTSVDGVGVVPLGAVDERTGDLVDSERFAELLLTLRTRFDHVVVATAPAAVEPAALAVSAGCDGVLAVVELGSTTGEQVRAAAASLDGSGSALIGAVALGAPARRATLRSRKSLAALLRRVGGWIDRRRGRRIDERRTDEQRIDEQRIDEQPIDEQPPAPASSSPRSPVTVSSTSSN
ncbi:Wzz/FepE/Etk N-terminal domain-containing protein [Actinomycetospora chibensis]|uniref:Wzz/FepE/Etk N-terminal domain-containing protein n=1 Tax=Actinomycetospora chibensis TaxID=663606 RepID=A0ABV9RKN3_9PSEU|nr:Wzz/FepE/Etk N-terminal domain-containing protein [Actinomycetospora chibensis]MDD7923286.1 Wzz/FepE/Etk N-terminal domain-containing protein [Actinomycetospora chibensis]